MRKVVCYLLVMMIFFIDSSEAKISHLSCSKNGLHIVFINGVNVDKNEIIKFRSNSALFADSLDISLLDTSQVEEKVRVSVFWNQSFMAEYDGFEAWRLYMERQKDEKGEYFSETKISEVFMYAVTNNVKKLTSFCPKFSFYRKFCNELHSLTTFKQTYEDLNNMKYEIDRIVARGRKILFVSHSAGALFVDTIRDYIKKTYGEEVYLNTSHLALARPLETNHKNQYYLTFFDDEITEMLRSKPVVGERVPPANFKRLDRCFDSSNPNDEYINHDYDICYLGNALAINESDRPILESPEEMTVNDHVKNAVYRVASYLINNDISCCNKARNGNVWINDNGIIGGFLSGSVKILSGKIKLERGAQICGEGTIAATNFESDHIFEKSTLIEGKINLNSKFKIENDVRVTKKGELISEIGPDKLLHLSKTTVDGKIQFLPRSFIPQFGRPYAYMFNSIVKGMNVLDGASSVENSPGILNVEVKNASDLIVLNKIDVKPGARLHSKNVNNTTSVFNELMTQYPLTFNNQKVTVTNGKFYGVSTFNGGELQINNANLYGSNVVTSAKINLTGNLTSLTGDCDHSVKFAGNINQPFTFGNCDKLDVNLVSNGPVMSSGSVTMNGRMELGGNISVGKQESKGLGFGLIVSGTSNISAPNGFNTGSVTVSGNFTAISSCQLPSGIQFQMAHYTKDFSYNIPQDTDGYSTLWCFDHSGSPDNIYCGPSGIKCDGSAPKKTM